MKKNTSSCSKPRPTICSYFSYDWIETIYVLTVWRHSEIERERKLFSPQYLHFQTPLTYLPFSFFLSKKMQRSKQTGNGGMGSVLLYSIAPFVSCQAEAREWAHVGTASRHIDYVWPTDYVGITGHMAQSFFHIHCNTHTVFVSPDLNIGSASASTAISMSYVKMRKVNIKRRNGKGNTAFEAFKIKSHKWMCDADWNTTKEHTRSM